MQRGLMDHSFGRIPALRAVQSCQRLMGIRYAFQSYRTDWNIVLTWMLFFKQPTRRIKSHFIMDAAKTVFSHVKGMVTDFGCHPAGLFTLIVVAVSAWNHYLIQRQSLFVAWTCCQNCQWGTKNGFFGWQTRHSCHFLQQVSIEDHGRTVGWSSIRM